MHASGQLKNDAKEIVYQWLPESGLKRGEGVVER